MFGFREKVTERPDGDKELRNYEIRLKGRLAPLISDSLSPITFPKVHQQMVLDGAVPFLIIKLCWDPHGMPRLSGFEGLGCLVLCLFSISTSSPATHYDEDASSPLASRVIVFRVPTRVLTSPPRVNAKDGRYR